MATVLSGTSGALYYKPAGTSVELAASAFPSTGSSIQVGAYLGFKVNDPVTLTYPAGATTTNAIAAGAKFVQAYNATTGVLALSATAGGSALTATALPSAFGGLFATIAYTNFAAVGDVREWSFEITREEIDVTTIGQTAGQYAPFRRYITGFAGVKAKAALSEGVLLGVKQIGAGKIVYMADDPIFRNFWEGGKLILTNAVFLHGQ